MRRLILRPGAIGDFIVSLPALEFLKTTYTEIWTTEANVPLASFADRAGSLVANGIDTLGLPGRSLEPAVMRRLRGFDSIVSWYGTARPEFREAMADLPVEFHPALPQRGCGMHAVDYYLAQVGAPLGTTPLIPVDRRDAGWAAIHPFSGGRSKNWPLPMFRELAAALEVPVAWSAGPEESLHGATRFDNLRDLGQWLAGASVYVGNDSGISHLAAAAGVPVVALFGPTDSSVWAPRGRQVTVIQSPDGSMESIAVNDVLAAVRTYLRK